MAAELEADLVDAVREGVSVEELVARSFAAARAAEQAVPRPRARRSALVLAAIAVFVALALSGTGLVLFAGADHTSRATGPVTLALRPSPPGNAVTVTGWTSYAPLPVTTTRDHTRTIGIVLLLVGLGGAAGSALLLTRGRFRRAPARFASR